MNHYPEVERSYALMMTVLNVAVVLWALLDERRAHSLEAKRDPVYIRLDRWHRWVTPVAYLVVVTIPAYLIWGQLLSERAMVPSVWVILLVTSGSTWWFSRRKSAVRREYLLRQFPDRGGKLPLEVSPEVKRLLDEGHQVRAARVYMQEQPDTSLAEVMALFQELKGRRVPTGASE